MVHPHAPKIKLATIFRTVKGPHPPVSECYILKKPQPNDISNKRVAPWIPTHHTHKIDVFLQPLDIYSRLTVGAWPSADLFPSILGLLAHYASNKACSSTVHVLHLALHAATFFCNECHEHSTHRGWMHCFVPSTTFHVGGNSEKGRCSPCSSLVSSTPFFFSLEGLRMDTSSCPTNVRRHVACANRRT